MLLKPAEVSMGSNALADTVGALIAAEVCSRRLLPISPRPLPPQWHEGGSGPAAVLVNGWGASGLQWPGPWLQQLERDFHVIRPDNRGIGRHGLADAPFRMTDLAEDVIRVLDILNIDRALVLGLSMGGMIAQEIAIRSPDRVSGLVLVATRPPVPAHRPELRSTVLWDFLRPPRCGESLEVYARRLWALAVAPGFADRHPEVLDEVVHNMLSQMTPRTLLVQQARAAFAWGHSERLAHIAAPTTIVHGSDDPLVDVENGRALARLIPNSTYIELPGVGHLVTYEATERLREIVVQAAGEASS